MSKENAAPPLSKVRDAIAAVRARISELEGKRAAAAGALQKAEQAVADSWAAADNAPLVAALQTATAEVRAIDLQLAGARRALEDALVAEVRVEQAAARERLAEVAASRARIGGEIDKLLAEVAKFGRDLQLAHRQLLDFAKQPAFQGSDGLLVNEAREALLNPDYVQNLLTNGLLKHLRHSSDTPHGYVERETAAEGATLLQFLAAEQGAVTDDDLRARIRKEHAAEQPTAAVHEMRTPAPAAVPRRAAGPNLMAQGGAR